MYCEPEFHQQGAARAAQCEEFIIKLPQGYDTPAGTSSSSASAKRPRAGISAKPIDLSRRMRYTLCAVIHG